MSETLTIHAGLMVMADGAVESHAYAITFRGKTTFLRIPNWPGVLTSTGIVPLRRPSHD